MILAQQDTGPLVQFSLAPLSEEYGIPLAVMGILVVFMALTLVVTFISVLPHVAARLTAKSAPRSAESLLAAQDELPEEIRVVIAAAVAATIPHPHRVVLVRGTAPSSVAWSLEGRIQHHQSHRIPHRDQR